MAHQAQSSGLRWLTDGLSRSGLRVWWVSLVCGGVWIAIASPALANSWPPMAIYLSNLPVLVSLASGGVGLGLIIAVETVTLKRNSALPWRRCLALVAGANLYSTVVGLLFLLAIIVLPIAVFSRGFGGLGIGMIPMGVALWLGSITQGLVQWRQSRPRCFTNTTFVCGLLWLGVMAAVVVLVNLVPQLSRAALLGQPFPDGGMPFHINLLRWGAVLLHLAVGFSLSVVTESFFLALRWPQAPRNRLLRLVTTMNLRSHAYAIALPWVLLLLWSRTR